MEAKEPPNTKQRDTKKKQTSFSNLFSILFSAMKVDKIFKKKTNKQTKKNSQ